MTQNAVGKTTQSTDNLTFVYASVKLGIGRLTEPQDIVIFYCQMAIESTRYCMGDEQMVLLTIGKGDFHFSDTEFLDAYGADGALKEWHELVTDERATEDFERVFKRDLIARLLERARLTRLERTVVEGFAQGDNHAEIARELGVSRQRVVQALKSAINKLRAAAIELGELQSSMPSNSNASK